MATGLMIVLLGEATKVSPYLLEKDKSYRVRAQLGVRSDTLDLTGTILERKPVQVTENQVREAALSLQGSFELAVPAYSAVKVNGEKLYEKARRQEDFEPPRKNMNFYDVRVVAQGPDWIEADLRCSKGSYIRSWVELLGQNLGTGAAMSALRRLSSEPFHLQQASTLEELSQSFSAQGKIDRSAGFLSLPDALPHWKVARVDGQDLALIRNGQISHNLKTILISLFRPGVDEGVKILSKTGGELLALVGLEEGQGFVVRRVFRY
jgi:tRNA pseudouridine55 synthase